MRYSNSTPGIGVERPEFSDFKDANFIIYCESENSPFPELVRQACQRYGFVPREVAVVKNTMELLASVKNLGYVTIVDELCSEINNSSFRYIEMDAYIDIYLAWMPREDMPFLPIFASEAARRIAARNI